MLRARESHTGAPPPARGFCYLHMGDRHKRSLLLIIEQGEFRRTHPLVWAALERKIRKRNLIFSFLQGPTLVKNELQQTVWIVSGCGRDFRWPPWFRSTAVFLSFSKCSTLTLWCNLRTIPFSLSFFKNSSFWSFSFLVFPTHPFHPGSLLWLGASILNNFVPYFSMYWCSVDHMKGFRYRVRDRILNNKFNQSISAFRESLWVEPGPKLSHSFTDENNFQLILINNNPRPPSLHGQ